MRSKKAVFNTIMSLLLEVVTVISGFILPRLILSRFGSSYNGVTSSITQFIGYVSLLTAGVGGVTRASLYKPLQEKDTEKISAIIKATELFMRRVALIFTIGLFAFAVLYPFLVLDDFSWFFTFTMVLILGIGTFARYFFGLTYQMVLSADQRQYVNVFMRIITTILNILIAYILIKGGFSIHAVKLGSSLVFALNPIYVFFYVRHKYKIIDDIEPDTSAIEQRWDAFAHQIANFVHNNTDIVILSFFSNVREISVYTVYYGVSSGIKKIITSVATGIEAAFGNMIAKDEMGALNRNLSIFEVLIYALSSMLFTTMALLIIFFVSIYTHGITDADYIRPIFGYLIAVVEFFFCVRIPYQAVARAAGHYRETRNGAIFEAVLNIVISLALVKSLGLIGITIGTISAMLFRTLQYSVYVYKNIVHRSLWDIVKRFVVSALNIAAIVFLSSLIKLNTATTYLEWAVNGFKIFSVALAVTLAFCYIFYSKEMTDFWRIIRSIAKRAKGRVKEIPNR
ncbi:MAG TPA: polysaccharide biosynthesis C-terminal domain-containing protein [Clostridia bacterium]|nr:polysaccharide biosynthesis C-terminal domain-containing protein [Clostridia bacterium]